MPRPVKKIELRQAIVEDALLSLSQVVTAQKFHISRQRVQSILKSEGKLFEYWQKKREAYRATHPSKKKSYLSCSRCHRPMRTPRRKPKYSQYNSLCIDCFLPLRAKAENYFFQRRWQRGHKDRIAAYAKARIKQQQQKKRDRYLEWMRAYKLSP